MPERVMVKLSSEAAGYVSMTPVLGQEMGLVELVEQVVGVVGREGARVREVLKRGSVVSGATRFRWAGLEAEVEEVEKVLARVPGPEPGRAFRAENCVKAELVGDRRRVEVSREAGQRRRLFRRRSYWEVLMELGARAEYGGYEYRERADKYFIRIDIPIEVIVRKECVLLSYSALARQVEAGQFARIEYTVRR